MRNELARTEWPGCASSSAKDQDLGAENRRWGGEEGGRMPGVQAMRPHRQWWWRRSRGEWVRVCSVIVENIMSLILEECHVRPAVEAP
jgi:hypothetical protein